MAGTAGTDRLANPAIAEMPGEASLPRRSGELVFHDQWERRVFALAVALCEQGHYSWDEFRDHLIAEIGAAGTRRKNPIQQATPSPITKAGSPPLKSSWLRRRFVPQSSF